MPPSHLLIFPYRYKIDCSPDLRRARIRDYNFYYLLGMLPFIKQIYHLYRQATFMYLILPHIILPSSAMETIA